MHCRFVLLRSLLACSSLIALMPLRTAAAATFQGLGDLPGGSVYSQAFGVSLDGSTVVGQSNSANGVQGFRWTASEGMIEIGDLPGGAHSGEARAASANGSVIVGSSSSTNGDEAFRWSNGSPVGLGDLFGGIFQSFALSVSSDGAVIVGTGRDASGTMPIRWTDSGIQKLDGFSIGATGGSAMGVSGDGNTVVGRADLIYFPPTFPGGQVAFVWTEATGMYALGDLPGGGLGSGATAVNWNGSVIVGWGNSANGMEAFRWSIADGMIGLGDLPGGNYSSIANAVSTNGDVVVGQSSTGAGGLTAAFIWKAETGMISIKDYLVSQGASGLDGWLLLNATGISGDGRTIVGQGLNPAGRQEAWIATMSVPEPSTWTLLAMGALMTTAAVRRRQRA